MTTQFTNYSFADLSRIDEMMQIGVYKIVNLANNKIYIGQTSKSFYSRWRSHLSNLRCDRHINRHLQNSWNKYGQESFQLEIVEIIDIYNKVLLDTLEQKYLDLLKPELNICTVVGTTTGIKYTEEQKHKNSLSHRTSKPQSNNSSSCRGVAWDKSRNRWMVTISVNNKTIGLGRFDLLEDAIIARKEAESYYWSQQFLSLSEEDKNKLVNKKKMHPNQSGHKGINWSEPGSKWRVRVNGKQIAAFKNLDDAIEFKNNLTL